jgi:hypothetical protein
VKAITIKQPWAALIAVGAKQIETRGWRTEHRGPLAIHSAATLLPGTRDHWREECTIAVGHRLVTIGPIDCLPLGAVVAVADLVDVIRIDLAFRLRLSVLELTFGDYADGRIAWVLRNVRALREPIPARGMLGLWEWQAPSGLDLEGRLREAGR